MWPVFADRDKKLIETLGQRRRKEGRLHIDLLQRFGEDLLGVVNHLEEQGIPHRDIKPDNIAVGKVGKGDKLHVVLFDFSLSRTPAENIRAGTTGYIDPLLPLRKPPRWDLHAERYAAAMTLHEMATGTLPQWGDGTTDPSHLPPGTEITVNPEAFDTGLREGLTAFFQKAFRRDVTERFDNAEEMLSAWRECFKDIEESGPISDQADESKLRELLSAATEDTPIAELGLGTRATNALDRANILTVEDLLTTTLRRLSRLPGVGNVTRREITAAAKILRERLGVPSRVASTTDQSEPPPEMLDLAKLSVDLLADRLQNIGTRESEAVYRTMQLLLNLPSSLPGEGQRRSRRVRALHLSPRLPGEGQVRGNRRGTVRLQIVPLAGLLAQPDRRGPSARSEPGEGRADRRKAPGSLGQGPGHHPASFRPGGDHGRPGRRDDGAGNGRGCLACPRIVAGSPPWQAACLRRGPCRGGSGAVDARTAAGRRARDGECILIAHYPSWPSMRVAWARWPTNWPTRTPWWPRPAWWTGCGRSRPRSRSACPIRGSSAWRPPSPGSRDFQPAGTLPARHAGRSGRPAVAWGAERPAALDRGPGEGTGCRPLSGGRSAARPPVLDDLLREAGFDFRWEPGGKDGQGCYVSNVRDIISVTTGTQATPRLPTTSSRPAAGEVTPEEADARQFEERLQRAISEGSFLSLLVNPKLYDRARQEICRRFPVELVDMEGVFLDALQAVAGKAGVNWDLVLKTDAMPQGGDWDKLMMLVSRAMPAVEQRLLMAERTVLLIYPGLLARYDQMDLLSRLSQKVGRRDGIPGLWLLLPGDHQALIDGKAVPLLGPGQKALIPESWLQNLHRGDGRGLTPSAKTQRKRTKGPVAPWRLGVRLFDFVKEQNSA